MLNIRLIHTLLNPGRISIYLNILAILGLNTLLDILICIQLASWFGLWFVMAILSILTAINVLIVYRIIPKRHHKMSEISIHANKDETIFAEYVSSLIAAIFLIIPGFVNTLLGFVLMFSNIALKLIRKVMRFTGIHWSEVHEYLTIYNLDKD